MKRGNLYNVSVFAGVAHRLAYGGKIIFRQLKSEEASASSASP